MKLRSNYQNELCSSENMVKTLSDQMVEELLHFFCQFTNKYIFTIYSIQTHFTIM